MKTKQEIDQLKADWHSDGGWDIEDAEGFKEHREELIAYRKQVEAQRAARRAKEHEEAIRKIMRPALDCLPVESSDTLSRTVAEMPGTNANIIFRAVAEMLLPIVQRLDRLDERQEAELRKLEEHVDQQVRPPALGDVAAPRKDADGPSPRRAVNRRRQAGVHGVMNRPDMYMKQLAGQAVWLRAQGDEYGAEQAEKLAERYRRHYEAVDDQTTPGWLGTGDALDTEPAIRCWPEVGRAFERNDGPHLTTDPDDGGTVPILHMGDVARWMSGRIDADASEQKTRAAGEAQAQLDAERIAYDATVGSGYEVGDVIDAEFEVTEDDGPYSEAVAGGEVEHPDERMDARELDAQEDSE